MAETIEPREPYRLFFPLGIAMAATGVAPWILFSFGWISSFPNVFHGRVMFHGFLMSFISGFLMTAVPRMSGTEVCRPSEAAAVLALLALQLLAADRPIWSAALFTAHSAFLLFFVARRAIQAGKMPIPSFVFVPVGLAAAMLGGALIMTADLLPAPFEALGKLLSFQGFVLNLIIGLGSRLIPRLSHVPGALSPQEGGGRRQAVLPLAMALNLSFPIEAFLNPGAGILLRALSLSWAAFTALRIFAPMTKVTALGLALRFSTLMMILPYFLILAFPERSLHWLHLSYIAGIGLMTLMIGVRVVLAHGGGALEKERASHRLVAAAALVFTAMLLRTIGPLLEPERTLQFYAIAASFWLAGLFSWFLLLKEDLRSPFAVFHKLISPSRPRSK